IARYLSSRIDRDTAKEDQMLVKWSTEAVKSSAFNGFCLSDLEYGVKTYHDHLRKIIPVVNLNSEPIDYSLNEYNNKLLAKKEN
ncbi:MAG: aromatic ring-hydroxylating dioxygenase subunit alpha, partial [Pseudomonadota bacterium]|nr:aromatic ring-hydroxylating dioxygenase subunit alpha [Pseudomonadota bacterium]